MVPLIIVHNGLGVLLFCALFAFMCDALKEIKASITLGWHFNGNAPSVQQSIEYNAGRKHKVIVIIIPIVLFCHCN